MRTVIEVATQFRGPPKSVNGGYACGLMGRLIEGPSRGVLRAPPPLETPLALVVDDGVVRLESLSGDLIGEATAASAADIPAPPPSPGLAAAAEAARAFPGLERPFHPVCFSCGDQLDHGFGLRVFTGQVAGAPEGVVAGPWTPHAAFAGADGLIPPEVVWAALDCPGSVAWVVSGAGGGMLGTMTCRIERRPAPGEACLVTAWPIERSGRKLVSGTALFSAEGELLAASRQIWIGRAPLARAA
ncbi:MAG: hypothetical protein ACREEW_13160 [Caulobacteraceae bacterium]